MKLPLPFLSRRLNRVIVALCGLTALPLALSAQSGGARPDDNRFTPVQLTPPGTLDEPMVFEVLRDGRAFIAERRGTIKMFDPGIGGVKVVGSLAVNNRTRQGNGEQGLVGLTLHPKYPENGWIYLYYQHPTEEKSVLSRWVVRNDVLVANSEKVLMDWPAQRETCCHSGGGMTWDPDGNLYLTVGNNRGNNLSAHTDERPGRAPWDDQGGAANTASLEGKILRIHPEDDGTYTIPKGNLFPEGTPKTRPEIYTMGHRNAWRVSRDSQTGFIYWGEVGPDGRQNTDRGPMGYDEFNQARKPGFFGWPYFVGTSAFPHWNYADNKPGATNDPARPINGSPNNTGLTELPPLAPPFIWYPYGVSEKFPELGSGGRSATGGPIFHQSDFNGAKRLWPAYFEGKWIITDLSRRWIMLVSMHPNGDFKSLERFLPDYRPVEPIDMKFGPDGDLYVLEYGGRWFQASPEAKLTRIEFEGGNRKPIAVASASREGGVPPFEVTLSSAGTKDYDGDALKYRWEVFGPSGKPRVFEEATPVVKFEDAGAHVARLTVTDPTGASDSRSVPVISGNEPPVVKLSLKGNETFYFAEQPFGYAVEVEDREDGKLSDGKVPVEKVALSIDYVPAGFDVASLKSLPRGEAAAARFPVAQTLLTKGNCKACHLVEGKLVGPSFVEIARKYAGQATALRDLSKKVVTGGSGVWGQLSMPPNPFVNESEAGTILKYVLSLADPVGPQLPLAGEYAPKLPPGDPGTGSILVRAVYTDQGSEGVPPLTGESLRMLRSPVLPVTAAAVKEGVEPAERGAGQVHSGSVVAFRQVDLTGVRQVEVVADALTNQKQPGGIVEVRLGSATGTLVGTAKIEPRQVAFGGGGGGGGRRGRGPAGVSVTLPETKGRHDLFLVFRNEAAADAPVLMSFSSLRLSATAPAAQPAPDR